MKKSKIIITIILFLLCYITPVHADFTCEEYNTTENNINYEYPNTLYAEGFGYIAPKSYKQSLDTNYGPLEVTDDRIFFPFNPGGWGSYGYASMLHTGNFYNASGDYVIDSQQIYCLSPHLYSVGLNKDKYTHKCEKIQKLSDDQAIFYKTLVALDLYLKKGDPTKELTFLEKTKAAIVARIINADKNFGNRMIYCGDPEKTVLRGGGVFQYTNEEGKLVEDGDLYNGCYKEIMGLHNYYEWYINGKKEATKPNLAVTTDTHNLLSTFKEQGRVNPNTTLLDEACEIAKEVMVEDTVNKYYQQYIAPTNTGAYYLCTAADDGAHDVQTMVAYVYKKDQKRYVTGCVDPDIAENINIQEPKNEGTVLASKNCCIDGDGITTMKNIDGLDKMFDCDCYLGSETYRLKVDDGDNPFYYEELNGSYQMGQVDGKYCRLYCTDQITYKNTKPTVIGGYNNFILETISINDTPITTITSQTPIAKDERECRVRIRYDNWLSDMSSVMDSEVISYNSYQQHRSMYEMLQNDTVNTESTAGYKVVCEPTGQWNTDCTYREAYTDTCITYENKCEDVEVEIEDDDDDDDDDEPKTKIEQVCTEVEVKEKCTKYRDVSSEGIGSSYGSHTHQDSTFGVRVSTFKTEIPYWIVKKDTKDADISFNGRSEALSEIIIKSAGQTKQSHTEQYMWAGSYRYITNAKTSANQYAINYANAHSTSKDCPRNADDGTYNVLHAGYSCTVYPTGALDGFTGLIDVKYEDEIAREKAAYETAQSSYEAATEIAKDNENQMYVCQNYFKQFEGYNNPKIMHAENHNFAPNIDVYYNQYYLTEYGEHVEGVTYREFKRVCITQDIDPIRYKVSEIKTEYTDLYGTTPVKIKDFRCTTSPENNIKKSRAGSGMIGDEPYTKPECAVPTILNKADQSSNDFEGKLDLEYEQEPIFSRDAKFMDYCYWESDGSFITTMSPSGLTLSEAESSDKIMTLNEIVKNPSTLSRTRHTIVSYLKTSVYTGQFSVLFDVSNSEPTGIVDKLLESNGQMCNGKGPDECENYTPLSCILDIRQIGQLITTSYCPSGADDPYSYGDPYAYGYVDPPIESCTYARNVNLSFRVVDPKNIFTDCDNLNSEERKAKCFEKLQYAYNWLIEDGSKYYKVLNGNKSVLDDMRSNETYYYTNKSYSFRLNSSDLKAIKDYNQAHLSSGGYEDFDLTCECPSETNEYFAVDTNTGEKINSVIYNDGCRKCKSDFIDNLSNGKIIIDKNNTYESNHKVWNNEDKNLINIRKNVNWW